jgi:protein CpxP
MAFSRSIKVGLAALGIAALVGGATALAQGGPGGFGHGRRGMGPMGFEGMRGFAQLGLTDDQRQQIRTAVTSHRDEFRALMERGRQARDAQRAAIEAMPVNEQAVRAAAAQVAAVEADTAVLRARVHEQVFSVLTPDQQAKAQAMKAERDQHRAQMRAERQQWREQHEQPPAAPPQER